MSWRRTKPSLTSLVALFLIVTPMAYLLSYAPWIYIRGEKDATYSVSLDRTEMTPLPRDASKYPPYRLADWTIDHTILRKPLFLWAGIWGVRENFEKAYQYRKYRRMMSIPEG